jgi:hypothetical protein
MALIQLAVGYKNGVAYSKTLLLNTDKFGDVQSNSTYADFWYEDYGKKVTKYTTSATTKDQVVALLNSTLYENRIELSMLGKSTTRSTPLPSDDLFASATVINIDANKVVKGWTNADTTTSTLQVAIGEKYVTYKVDATIAEIESASSTSVSIA